MTEITLSNDTVQFINLASKTTGAGIRDCVVESDLVVFIVEKGQLGIAIGTKAKNLEKLRYLTKKTVKFVEYSDDPKTFVKNLCKPYLITNITFDGEGDQTVAKIEVNPRDKSKLIGKGGRNINMIRKLAHRHHPIRDVQVI